MTSWGHGAHTASSSSLGLGHEGGHVQTCSAGVGSKVVLTPSTRTASRISEPEIFFASASRTSAPSAAEVAGGEAASAPPSKPVMVK